MLGFDVKGKSHSIDGGMMVATPAGPSVGFLAQESLAVESFLTTIIDPYTQRS